MPSLEADRSVPLVSCLMPTHNRRQFVGQALWYFLRQDYPRKELVILDDGEDSVADLVPPDERIRYVRLDRPLLLGAKRNIGCEMSRGDFIAHWDDDDWIAPHRLSAQVRELIDNDADVCGTGELLHYAIDHGEAWLYRRLPEERTWLAGGTLLYRREVWQRAPFPEIDVGEDTEFVNQQAPERIRAAADSSFYVALIHRGNTAAKRLTDPHWQRCSLDDVSRLLALDRDFYAGLRNAPHPAFGHNLPAPGETVREAGITVAAPFIVYDGYGSMAEFLVLGMVRAGATVNAVPMGLELRGLSDELTELIRRSKSDPTEPMLFFSWPHPELDRFSRSRDPFIYTMWESSRLPVGWTDRLNAMRAVLVPTRFVAEVCRRSGVTVPIEVVPLGVDPAIHHYIERPERPNVTTLIVGTVIGRKNVREGVAAWKKAFEGDREARLIIKSRFRYGNYQPDDPRIAFLDDNEPTRGIAHWYEQADVLIAAGNEGFGLPLVEGMSTGLPVIALDSEGQHDTCADAGNERVLPVAPARWEEYDEPVFGRAGVRGVPDIDAMVAHLHWVAEHRADAREMGKAASAWALEQRNVWNTGPMVLEAMERHARPARTLRRVPTLWVPSWQTPCGIAEYTAHLIEGLPNVRVAANAPDFRGARLLHVQHQHALFNDTLLTNALQRARLEQTPVVITEHTVCHDARAWEREAHLLTALTQAGAQILRTRWPDKRVEYLPYGCSTWFPPRKKTRSRIVGAFGFLEPHKGFWKLLDALRAIPDSELLLVSHAKNPENEARWSRAAAGLPVRHHKDFMPVEQAAQLLAAEADVLVYWYDEVDHLSASGAVRVGLATGVPVLVSPTNWFRDLRAVTWQPNDLVEGLRQLFDDTRLRDELSSAARDYCRENSWAKTAERHQALWRSLDAVN
jgi:glycosyltransferase involved in cell wall biosynthesis